MTLYRTDADRRRHERGADHAEARCRSPASFKPCPTIRRMHVAAPGAERHADADLLRPLRHRVRQHAVDADRREHQRDRRRTARNMIPNSRYCQKLRCRRVFHRRDLEDRQRRIRQPDLLADRRGDRRRIAGDADREARVQRRLERIRHVGRRGHRLVAVALEVPEVGDDADDREPVRDRVRPSAGSAGRSDPRHPRTASPSSG